MDVLLSQSFAIEGKNFLEAGRVSTEIRRILKDLGVDGAIVRRAAIAAYEAEMNVVMYAEGGTLTLDVTPEVMKVVIEDRGPGIPDVALAMKEGYSTATQEMRELGFGAGMGLPNIKRNADRLDIRSRVGKGTTLEFTITIA
jgi:anti-sigma regulatory factor (Ser/Thr protein kinase)